MTLDQQPMETVTIKYIHKANMQLELKNLSNNNSSILSNFQDSRAAVHDGSL